ncbi:MAG TPA: VOC family protein, partial [Chloroflexota bacterium]
MITNVSLVNVFCLDQGATRDFYVDVLGFVCQADVTTGDGYRWLTVAQPDHPELQLTLMKPGPPLDAEAAEFIRRQLDKGGMGGLGL